MKLTDEQRKEIESAVIDMSIVDWGLSDAQVRSYAERVTWWIENHDAIENGEGL